MLCKRVRKMVTKYDQTKIVDFKEVRCGKSVFSVAKANNIPIETLRSNILQDFGVSNTLKIMLELKKDEKIKKERIAKSPSKVIIRHLPPGLTKEELLEVISPLPSHDWFVFCDAEKMLGGHSFTRAYINFTDINDIYQFRDQFDGYVFVDHKGNESQAVVEYAPFQKLSRRSLSPKHKDPRMGTITEDPDYQEFLNRMENPEPVTLPGTEKMLEEIEASELLLKANNGLGINKTPLVDFIEQKRAEINRKFEFKMQYEFMKPQQLERLLKKEEKKEIKRLRRLEKRKLRDERFAKKLERFDVTEAKFDEEDEYEDIDDDEYDAKAPTKALTVNNSKMTSSKQRLAGNHLRPEKRLPGNKKETTTVLRLNRRATKYDKEKDDGEYYEDRLKPSLHGKESNIRSPLSKYNSKKHQYGDDYYYYYYSEDKTKKSRFDREDNDKKDAKYSKYETYDKQKENSKNVISDDITYLSSEYKSKKEDREHSDALRVDEPKGKRYSVLKRKMFEKKQSVLSCEGKSTSKGDMCESKNEPDSKRLTGDENTFGVEAAYDESSDIVSKNVDKLVIENKSSLKDSNTDENNEKQFIADNSNREAVLDDSLPTVGSEKEDKIDMDAKHGCAAAQDTRSSPLSVTESDSFKDESDCVGGIVTRKVKEYDECRETSADDTTEICIRHKDGFSESSAIHKETEKSTEKDPRRERKIRNKDRPAMQLYRPGQSRLASRLKQDAPSTSGGKGSNAECGGGSSGCGGGSVGSGGGSSNSSTPSPGIPDDENEAEVKEVPVNEGGSCAGADAGSGMSKTFRRTRFGFGDTVDMDVRSEKGHKVNKNAEYSDKRLSKSSYYNKTEKKTDKYYESDQKKGIAKGGKYERSIFPKSSIVNKHRSHYDDAGLKSIGKHDKDFGRTHSSRGRFNKDSVASDPHSREQDDSAVEVAAEKELSKPQGKRYSRMRLLNTDTKMENSKHKDVVKVFSEDTDHS